MKRARATARVRAMIRRMPRPAYQPELDELSSLGGCRRDARPPPTRARRAHDFPSTARDASRALERVDRSVKRENRRIPRDVPRNTREGDREPSTVRARATRTASIE